MVACQEHQSLDYVSQFTEISGPGISCECLNRVRGERDWLPIVLSADLPRKMLHQGWNIVQALTQRRQDQRKDVHAMKEILIAEPVHGTARFTIRCQGQLDQDLILADDPEVHHPGALPHQ